MKKYLLLLLLIIPLVNALDVTVYIDPVNATTTTTLHCVVYVNATGTLTANISWYVNGAPHPSDTETITLTSGQNTSTTNIGDLEPADTIKHQTWVCQAQVSNTTVTNTSNSSSITIQNSPPVVTYPVSTQIAFEDSQYGPIIATATDADNDPIVGWVSTDLNASEYNGVHLFSITSAGQIQFTPDYTQVGNHTMALLASDGELLGGRNVVFSVVEINDSPELGPIIDQQVSEGETLEYYVYATDEENDPFDWLIESPLPHLNITKINETHALISITPTNNDDGNYSVKVTVYTIGNLSMNNSANFTLTINVTNKIPSVYLPVNPTVQQGNPYAVNFTAQDPDLNDTLSFNITANCDLPNIFSIVTLNNNATDATGQVTVANLTNDHVACREVNVSVTDTKNGRERDTNTTTFTLNIINVNDPPIIYQNSYYENSHGQTDIYNLTAPTGLVFYYRINYTDPDLKTYEGENLTFSDNTTLFDVNATTGEISFTPNNGQVGEHLILITLTDDDFLSDNIIMNLTIISNNPPTISAPSSITCYEDINCSFQVNGSDLDNDSITFSAMMTYQSTSSKLTPEASLQAYNITQNSTYYTRNYTNEHVGNYTYNITVTDVWGATNSILVNITVNNTNDPPYFDMDLNSQPDNISIPQPIVEGYTVSYRLNVSDDDLINNMDNLTLLVNITGPNTTLFSPVKVGVQSWDINFTPDENSDGNYSINFTIIDDAGASSTQIINFTLYNQSEPPQIEYIRPYYNNTINQSVDEMVNASLFPNNKTTTNTSEGAYTEFEINYTDADTSPSNLIIEWYLNGTLVSQGNGSNTLYNKSWSYFEAGNVTVTVVVKDPFYESTNFSWDVEIINVNRPPILKYDLASYELNATTKIKNYFDAFIDPDDDFNSNNMLDGEENSSLTYTYTAVSQLDIVISGQDVTLIPIENGNVTVVYTAIDPEGLTVASNPVTYNITVPPNETIGTTTSSSSSSSGGGSGGGSSTSYVPFPYKSDPEPYNIDIITPKPITTYNNDTVKVPLIVHNPSETVLKGITISAGFKNQTSNATITIDKPEITRLETDESVNVTLLIDGYLELGVYEIQVIAQVEDPEFEDTAVVLINSLERSKGSDEVQTKIRFARDLLSTNPECIELNELVQQAQRAVETGQTQKAQELLTAVIDGCRYLVASSEPEVQEPSGISLDWLLGSKYSKEILYGMIGLLILIASFLLIHYYQAVKQED